MFDTNEKEIPGSRDSTLKLLQTTNNVPDFKIGEDNCTLSFMKMSCTPSNGAIFRVRSGAHPSFVELSPSATIQHPEKYLDILCEPQK